MGDSYCLLPCQAFFAYYDSKIETKQEPKGGTEAFNKFLSRAQPEYSLHKLKSGIAGHNYFDDNYVVNTAVAAFVRFLAARGLLANF